MDTSEIIAKNTNTTTGIKIGREDAPKKVIEFVNLRCPYCKQWFDESKETYQTFIDSGNVQRIIKLFDKEKPGLDKGNVMHQYVPYDNETNALAALEKIYASQDIWGNMEDAELSFEEIAAYAETTLHLTRNHQEKTAQEIVHEANSAHIQFIPTMIIGEHIFDQKISQEAFHNYLAE